MKPSQGLIAPVALLGLLAFVAPAEANPGLRVGLTDDLDTVFLGFFYEAPLSRGHSGVFALEPAFPHGRQKMQAVLRGLLDRDPSLSYLAETDAHYQVKSHEDVLIHVPKNRAHLVPFPERNPGPTKSAMRWFNAAVGGMHLRAYGPIVSRHVPD